MNNQIQLVLKSSTTELPLNDREYGIYLVPELDGLTGLPAIRTTSGVNSGYDGGWTSAQNYDARSITIRGVIANEDVATVERLRKQLTSLAGQGKSEELTLDLVTEAGNAYTLQVRTIALEMAMQRVLKQQEFMLQLRADDPLIYDSSETAHEALIQVSKATGGFLINFELPLAITGGSEEAVVTNDGLEQVPTITRMYGALHNPKIINHTTNQSMQIMADLGYSEGDWNTPSDPVEGKVVELHNTPDNAPFSQFDLKGNTEQQTYTGKNLLKLSTADGTSIEKNGITATYNFDEQTITFNGTCTTDNTSFKISDNSINFTSGTTTSTTYYISGSISGYCQTRHFDASWGSSLLYNINTLSSSNPMSSATSNKTFTAANGTQQSIRFNSGSVASNFKIKIMVADSSDTSYEPYVGGAASPNPDYLQDVKVVTGENVVKVCGKNLLPLRYPYTETKNGVTFTVDSEGITLNGTTSTATDFYLIGAWGNRSISYCNIAAGTYRLTMFDGSHNIPSTAPFGLHVYDRLGTNNIGFASLSNGGSSSNAVNLSTDMAITAIYVSISYNKTFNNEKFYFQLEKSSQASAFEPYQEQSYEVNLGKNLLDINAGFTNTYIDNSGSELASTKIVLFNGYIPVQPSTVYTFSSSHSNANMTTVFYSSSKTFISRLLKTNTKNNTFTTPSNCRFVRLQTNYDNTTNMDASIVESMNLQLELGSATDYAPYFTPIELCKIGTYQDYIYKSGDKWYKHNAIGKYVYNNDLAENGIGSTHVAMLTPTLPVIPNLEYASGLFFSNSYTPIVHNNTGLQGSTSGSKIRINTALNIASDYATVRSLAAANNLTIYYPLADPTDTEITNEALLEQLNDMANLARTYGGLTYIQAIQSGSNAQATTEVSYMTEKNPDNRDLIVIDSRLRTITLNGLDVYHLQADGSEFIMLTPGENRISLQSDITGDNGYAEVSYKQGYLSI